LGISLSLWAVANATTGIAATLMALVPIFILVPTWWRGKERITKQQVAGAFISVGGAALLFV
jgi:drug/metabolite transporter (DMT)-like permease